MPRDQYQATLDALRSDVADLGADVLDQIDDGLRALETGDEDLAREVAAGDQPINERYLELEDDCIDLLALEQPVAGDLRLVAASFKILTDVERVGDLASNLGDYALTGASGPTAAVDLQGIGAAAREQFADAVAAYEAQDAAACRAVVAGDDEVDALCERASDQLVRGLVESGTVADSWDLERLLDDVSRVLLAIRDLERVGDHAVNVAARTLYAATDDAQHLH